jgi:hypothetical protein
LTGWAGGCPATTIRGMENDILIAGLMALGSVVWLVAIIFVIARATRETPSRPRVVDVPEPTPALRPAPGW